MDKIVKMEELKTNRRGELVYELDTLPEEVTRLVLPEGVVEIMTERRFNMDIVYPANSGLSEVVLPSTLKKIGDSTFLYFAGLKTVSGLRYVEKIGDSTFLGSGLTGEVTFGKGLKQLGVCSFCGCANITRLDFNESEVETIPVQCFDGCENLEVVTGMGNIRALGRYAFANCESLKELQGLKKLVKVGEKCFESCFELKEIKIGV